MTSLRAQVFNEAFAALVRALTGRLYSEEQIKTVTSSAVGRYFADFFPQPKTEAEAKRRVAAAQQHIAAASTMIHDIQEDLNIQSSKLDALLAEIDQKRKLADRYQALVATNEETFQAFRAEMEQAFRSELQTQAEEGRRVRQFVSIGVWLITLVAGAALGAYFEDMVAWVRGLG